MYTHTHTHTHTHTNTHTHTHHTHTHTHSHTHTHTHNMSEREEEKGRCLSDGKILMDYDDSRLGPGFSNHDISSEGLLGFNSCYISFLLTSMSQR